MPARFESIVGDIVASRNGNMMFRGFLITESGVTTSDNTGLWKFEGTSGSLLVRENGVPPGLPFANFSGFVPSALNNNNQTLVHGSLKLNPAVNATNNNGIWLYDTSGGQLIMRTGVGGVPGLGGASFSTILNEPIINNSGQMALHAQLTTGQEGLWRYSGDTGTDVAITGTPTVAGITDATFSSFARPLQTETGKILSLANLSVGPGGITESSDLGLWLFQDTADDQLLVRSGSGGVPEIPGANFGDVEFFALAGEGVLVQAPLEVGTGGVTTENDRGIWHIPFSGDAELLLREGDQLLGRTIQNLSFAAPEGAAVGLSGYSNDAGQFVFRADFTNGDSGLFLFTPGSTTEYAAADFNTDGFVDDEDLDMWRSAFDSTAAADADDDGDTDGRDFLIWQRQYTGGPIATAEAVPEPSVPVLLVLSFIASQFRMRFRLP